MMMEFSFQESTIGMDGVWPFIHEMPSLKALYNWDLLSFELVPTHRNKANQYLETGYRFKKSWTLNNFLPWFR